MRRLTVVGLTLAAVFALLALAVVGLRGSESTAHAQPLPPSRFFGSVTVNGAPADIGTTVRAKLGDASGPVCGQTLVEDLGLSGNDYAVDALHSGQQSGCGNVGETVVFEWVGAPPESVVIVCAPTGRWDNTDVQNVDLTCTQPTPSPSPTPTPPTPTPTPTPPTPTPTPTPAAPPVTGVGPSDDGGGFTWWPLALAGAALAAIAGAVALRRRTAS